MNDLIQCLIRRIFMPLFFIMLSSPLHADTGDISTAYLSGQPHDVAFDSSGNMYVADFSTYRIMKVAPSGVASAFAGTGTTVGPAGDFGPATAAYLDRVYSVYIDSNDDVYIGTRSRIRKVGTSGIITTIAGTGVAGFSGDGGSATLARIDRAYGMTSDSAGNFYFADRNNERVRKILPSGIIITAAGTGVFGFSGDGGPAIAAQLDFPQDVALDSSGNLYIADYSNNRIRKVTTNGFISTYQILSDRVQGLDIDGVGNVYAAIGSSGATITKIVKVDPLVGLTTLVSNNSGYSGDGGLSTSAQVGAVRNVTISSAGDLYLADYDNQRVRKIESIATVLSNVYRLYNPNNGEHLYTTSKEEYDVLAPLGWTQENVAFKALSGVSSVNGITAKPWLRVFNPNSGLHHWTAELSEYNGLGAIGWNQEGDTGYIFQSAVTGTVPLFRVYNPNDGNHHWTMDEAEKDLLVAIGWQYEGLGGYVYAPD